MAGTAVAGRGVSIALACRAFGVSETCYRYGPKLKAGKQAIVRHWFEHNGGEIADLLVGLTNARKTWGFGLCFLHLRNVKGHPWNHKRVYRIYCALELNLRSEPWNAVAIVARTNGATMATPSEQTYTSAANAAQAVEAGQT